MSGVVLRCPNCGTTRTSPGECDACHEAAVRYQCTNHAPGRWLDAAACPDCGARFGEPARPRTDRAPAPARAPAQAPAPPSARRPRRPAPAGARGGDLRPGPGPDEPATARPREPAEVDPAAAMDELLRTLGMASRPRSSRRREPPPMPVPRPRRGAGRLLLRLLTMLAFLFCLMVFGTFFIIGFPIVRLL